MIKRIIIALLIFLPSYAFADPCTDLAASFAENPDGMTIHDLATLRTCISDKLHEKIDRQNRQMVPAPRVVPAPGMMRAPDMMPDSDSTD